MKQLYFLLFSLFSVTLSAQNITEIQAFTYESTTRDTMIEFPEGDHNQYEKIIMLYSMRCKDGLVSDFNDRNKGCGEWDYSCNTNIIDSTRVDSISRISPTHVISNFSGDEFSYTNQPTYTYYSSVQKETIYDQVISETEYSINLGAEILGAFEANTNDTKIHMLYPASMLVAQGMAAGLINSIKLDANGGTENISHLRINLKHTFDESLSKKSPHTNGFQNVYYRNSVLDGTIENQFIFHSPFTWDGTSNIIVELTYQGGTSSDVSLLSSQETNVHTLISNIENHSIVFSGAEFLMTEEGIPSVSNEITISAWTYGDKVLPQNTYLFEGVDAANRRQINVHLPWQNGQVYWDCGNDGGGYDRINAPANEIDYSEKWNHWAFTKNAVSGIMEIYLNGELWLSGNDKFKPIDIKRFVLGGSANFATGYSGKVDEFRIWNKALSADEIKDWMHRSINSDHPSYANLVAYYNFETTSPTSVTDASSIGYDLEVSGAPIYRTSLGEEQLLNFDEHQLLPNLRLLSGDYISSTEDIIQMDSLINPANKVDEYIVVGTDLVLDNSFLAYQSGEMPILDEQCNQIGSVTVAEESTISIGQLAHYSKSPSKFEIMSFVTPYGINLDFGIEGKTWTFDLTDYGPILKGKKRLFMDRGGQWQEDMDIKFLFIEGTPQRDVLDVQQIWPVTAENYIVLGEQTRFEPRIFTPNPNATQYKMRATITGHGQEGEFNPQQHFFNLDGGTPEFLWSLTQECADNPVYPQGGTWIYDRMGWCPGEPSHVQNFELQGILTPGVPVELDYGLNTAVFGDSRYIINTQMVSYGETNFTLDPEVLDIIYPSNKIEHGRFNPSCTNPTIVLKNRGSEKITSLTIEYGVEGNMKTHEWTGNLFYNTPKEVELPPINPNALDGTSPFTVRISNPNGMTDEYSQNNEMSVDYDPVPVFDTDMIFTLKTNNVPSESSYRILDGDGNIIHQRFGGNQGSNTVRSDTLFNLNGCYTIWLEDTGDDGLDFWANNDGAGFFLMRSLGAQNTSVDPDFGKFVKYQFIAGNPVSTDDLPKDRFINIFPNPTEGEFNLVLDQFESDVQFRIVDQLGRVVMNDILEQKGNAVLQSTIDLTNHANGIYFVIISENGKMETRTIIKQ